MSRRRIAVKEHRILTSGNKIVGLQIFSTTYLKFGDARNCLTRNGFMLTDFFAKQTEFCVMRTEPKLASINLQCVQIYTLLQTGHLYPADIGDVPFLGVNYCITCLSNISEPLFKKVQCFVQDVPYSCPHPSHGNNHLFAVISK